MRKNILAVAVLSTFCGLVHADAISFGQTSTSGSAAGAGASSTIDIYQVATTTEADTGAGILNLTSAPSDQINLVQGNVVDNNLTIVQASTNQVANVVINAQLTDGAGTGLGDRSTGNIADITTAVAGSVGSNLDAATADGGTTNTLSLTQSNVGDVANIGIDGSNNVITVTQSTDNAVLNAVTHGTGMNYTIAQ